MIRRSDRNVCKLTGTIATLVLILTTFSVVCIYPASAASDDLQYIPLIERYEIVLFGRTYPDRDIESRVKAMEKSLFGASKSRARSRSVPETMNDIGDVIGSKGPVLQNPSCSNELDIEVEDDVFNSDSNTDRLFDQAYEAYDSGDLVTAEFVFRKIIGLNPEDMMASFNLASILEKQNRDKEAFVLYKRVVQFEPDNHVAQAAVRELSRFESEHPGSQRTRNKSDWVEDDNIQEFHISDNLDNRAATPNPRPTYRSPSRQPVKAKIKNPEDILAEAVAESKLKNYERSILLFRKYLYLKPETHQAKFLLARTYEAAGQKEMAKKVLRDALVNDPDNAIYKRKLASLDPGYRLHKLPEYGTIGKGSDGIVPMQPEQGERLYRLGHSGIGRSLRYALAGAAIGAASNSYYRGGMGRGALQGGLIGLALGLLRW